MATIVFQGFLFFRLMRKVLQYVSIQYTRRSIFVHQRLT